MGIPNPIKRLRSDTGKSYPEIAKQIKEATGRGFPSVELLRHYAAGTKRPSWDAATAIHIAFPQVSREELLDFYATGTR